MLNDREKLIELLTTIPTTTIVMGRSCGRKLVTASFIADYLIANGVTVRKKGKWKETGNRDWDGAELMRCSVCGCVTKGDYMNFCPNCGADMRGEEHG